MPLQVSLRLGIEPYLERIHSGEIDRVPGVPIGDGSFEAIERFSLTYTPEGREPAWRMDFAVHDGVPQCRGLTIDSGEDGREIRSTDLRGLRIEDFLELATVNVATRVERVGDEVHLIRDIEDLRSGASRRAARAARRDARRKVTDEALQEVAEVYRANLQDSPTDAVRRHLGVAERTARAYVRRARDAGFLGQAIRGKAGEL